MQEQQISCTSVFEKNYRNFAPILVNVGGVRSGKSYAIAQTVNAYSLEFTGLRTGVFRKIGATLNTSVIRPFIEVAQAFDIWETDNYNKSEKFYRYDLHDGNPTKSSLLFSGLDDASKLKSTEFNLIWLEEATDFTFDDFSFLQTRLSAKSPEGWPSNQIILSLNPSDARGWIKTKLLTQKDVCLIESTYKDNPFLSAAYIKTIEALKETNPSMYKMLVLNQWGVSDGIVFDKWQLYDEQTEPKNYDQVIYGLDFGFNHPTALIQCSFKENEVYLKEIIYQRHLTNGELVELMKEKERHGEINKDLSIIADSAEPDRIEEIFNNGFERIEGIKKIEVVRTINILKNYKIFIHKESKNLQDEFNNYEWKKSLSGEYLDKLEPDKQKDDGIAAVRYATQYYDFNAGAQTFYV